MKKWIVPGNINQFDIIGAFNKLTELDWTQKLKNVEPGDQVYIYVGAPISAIKICCDVVAVNLSPSTNEMIDDSAFSLQGEQESRDAGLYMRIRKVREYEDGAIPISVMRKHGIAGSIQGARSMPPELELYIAELEKTSMKTAFDETMKNEKRAWLLNWNPANWEWEDYEEACERTRNGEPYVIKWRSQSKKPVIGDSAYLIKTGKKPRGIVAHATVIEEASEDEHFDPVQAAAGKTTTFITVSFDRILDYKEAFIDQDELKEKIPEQQWSPQGSGIEIREPGRTQLRKMWQQLITGDNYWPSLSDYDPDISKEEYKRCMKDPSIVKYDSLDTVFRIYQYGGEATCTQLEMKYGGSASRYRVNAQSVARWIADGTECPKPEIGEGRSKIWPILFVGRNAINDEEGSWVWKLREPLEKAVAELDEEGFFEELKNGAKEAMNDKFDKNMILYGPPGTGKTYYSVIYAVAICDGRSLQEVQSEDYSVVLARYKELKNAGRVAFTTFHQSYGYEEFIEGIKPVLEKGKASDIEYKIEDGVFKEFCNTVSEVVVKTPAFEIDPDAVVWKITIESGGPNNTKTECFQEGNMRVGFDSDRDNNIYRMFVEEIQPGDIVISLDTRKTIDGIGIVSEGEVTELTDKEDYKTSRPVNWIATNIHEDILDINGGKQLSRATVARVPSMRIEDIIERAKKFNATLSNTVIEKKTQPHVFIIDEINRGNISKVFGELITLIETTKRKGAAEEMTATLPYSKEHFCVPDNVYIIGTMNTADRSIALMDTALRRRFDFIEMMPEPDILQELGADTIEADGEALDVATMLDRINARIEYLFDREHTIGHAFFTRLGDDPTIENLADIFLKNVIPLLQEYFYEDYSKIQLVLGDNGKTDEQYKFIKDTPIIIKDLFKGTPDLDLGETKFEINKDALYEIQSYLQI